MTQRIRTLAAVAAVVLGVTALPAQADDPRADTSPCVAKRELSFFKYGTLAQVSRDEFERRAEVYGKRINITRHVDGIGSRTAYLYKACGHSRDEVMVLVATERTDRPGYDRTKTPGERTVVAAGWWKLPTGYECGVICDP